MGITFAYHKSPKNKAKTAFIVFLINYISLIWFSLFIFLIIMLLPENSATYWFFFITPIVALVVCFLCMVMIVPYSNPLPPLSIDQKLALIIPVMLLPVIFTPFGDFLSSQALKAIRRGGDFQAVMRFYDTSLVDIPISIRQEGTSNYSKKLYFVLDIGDKIYVSLETNRANRKILSLNAKLVSGIDYIQP